FQFSFSCILARPKVYQGVRVKTTVRELLQQKRAQQAEKRTSEFQDCRMQLSDPSPTYSEMYNGFEASCSADSYHQSRHFPNYSSPDDSLSFLDQLFPDIYLPSDCLADSNFNFLQSSSSCALEGNSQLAPSFQQSMAPESPTSSDDMSNSFEYSPTYQEMTYNHQNHSAYQDPGSCTFANVDMYYQHQHNAACCYCVYCHSMEHQEAMKALEPYSYPSTNCMEYFPSSTVSEDLFPGEMNAYEVLQLR
ncbi:colorectal cancer-associated protein 2, partial [Xenopus tropicalis]|uniref:Colorectal cancer-associated protein 2 n=1 Tax=Xenopus tropicalis TaxID=8364 RepID=A0A8J1JVP7_XENTR